IRFLFRQLQTVTCLIASKLGRPCTSRSKFYMFVRSECIRKCAACLLVVLFTLPLTLAQTMHVVSPADLQKQTVATSQARQQNLQKVRDFLADPAATETLKKEHIDTEQVKKAVARIGEEEERQWAEKSKTVTRRV